MKYVLFNELSNNSKGKDAALELTKEFKEGEFELKSLIDLNMEEFVKSLSKEDAIYLVGGDGTLNHFVNDVDCDALENEVYLYAGGTGNDFLNDVAPGKKLLLVNKYLKNLPVVEVNGMTRKFINGIGYGIDGYCCEVGDKLKAKSDKPVNYTSIAIKGLLFHFKREKATVTVDGQTKEFKHVWLAPTMNGKFYGGGMKIAPEQERLEEDDKKVTTVVFTGKSKLHTLIVFPSIFKGQLGKKKKMTTFFRGKEVEVKFEKPCALQIDGETVLNVTEYKVHVK